MKTRYLYEEIDAALVKEWNDRPYNMPNTPKTRNLIDRVFQEVGDPEVLRQTPAVEKAVFKNLNDFGIEWDVNPFINIFNSWGNDFIGLKNLAKHIDTLTDMYKKGEIKNLEREKGAHLSNPSLYDRSDGDFRYLVRIFNTLQDLKAAKKYFYDTSVIDISKLYEGDSKDYDSSPIKKVGSLNRPDDMNTVIGIINSWAKDNDAGETKESDGNVSIERVLRDMGVTKNEQVTFLSGLMPDSQDQQLLVKLLEAARARIDTKVLSKLFNIKTYTAPEDLPTSSSNGTLAVTRYASSHPMETQEESKPIYWVRCSDGWYKTTTDSINNMLSDLAKRGQTFLTKKVCPSVDISEDELQKIVKQQLDATQVKSVVDKLEKDAKRTGLKSDKFAKAAYAEAERRSREAQRR